MRAEERHKMHQNELLEWLGQWIQRIKPYTNLLLLGVLVVVLGIAAVVWWMRQSADQSSLAWDGFYRALSSGNADVLKEIVAQNPGTDVAHWAAVLAGDVYLTNGCQRLFENKSQAIDDLQEALNEYRVVREESQTPALLERAWFGTARAYEALAGTRRSQGELDKAKTAYEEVVQKWPNGPYAKAAARRLKELGQAATKAFYDKFAQFDPRPALPDVPGVSGDRPPFSLDDLPEEGDLPALPESPEPGEAAPEGMPGGSPPAEGAAGTPAETEPAAQQDQPAPEPAPGQGPGEDASGQKHTVPEATPDTAVAPVEQPSDHKPVAGEDPSAPDPADSSEGP